ncbi:MAG: S8 family serine peptidase, partial [Candidatus Thorarchaeota archaeon]|nr:S8 family serine peptidase [Candidatus Thorarchaeota archaeon]
LVLMISLTFPVLATSARVNEPSFYIPEVVRTKLGQDAMSMLTSEEREIDAIVTCERDTRMDYLGNAKQYIGNFDTTRNWNRFNMFRATLTADQVVNLAKQPFVTRIDNNTREQTLCVNYARAYTQVNLLQYYVPSLDGNTDGSSTSYTKDDIVIAVLDTGIDTNHYDLDGGKVIGWKDFAGDIYGVKRTTPYDDNGHGTHCASVAAGTGDASYSYRGVALRSALVGVKVMDYSGNMDKSTAIDGLDWVGDNRDTYGIKIASCSWGFFDYGDYDSVAIAADRLAYYDNVIVCVAAGNEGSSGIRTPGTAKWVITVGSVVDPSEGGWSLASYSGRGPCDDGRIKPDILAPGTNIKAAKRGTYNQYIDMTGTSMATPFVAGTIAILLDKYPLLRYDYDADCNSDMKQLLMASAVDVPGDSVSGLDNNYGAGRIDALNEYTFIEGDVSTSSSDAPLVSNYQDKTTWWYNQPLWCRDNDYRSDWFKVNVYSGWFVWAMAWGDPDLLLKVYIYDKYLNLKASSTVGNDRNTGYTATYSGAYYIRVQSQQYTGDYYDIEIVTTAS